ncbi:MAG TPA: hypothetical protein V6C65_20575 [Allocoleopsis sp.]
MGTRSWELDMSSMGEESVPSVQSQADLDEITRLVRATALQHQQNSRELLALLRLLESLHKEIRDGLFQDALPDNRQALYAFLRDIEAGGGWPYIHRMKLQAFLAQMAEAEDNQPD